MFNLSLMCLVMGAVLGARRGMAFALMATMLSNLILSHGWWTLFQASGWAAVAFAGSRLGLIVEKKVRMTLIVSAAGSLLCYSTGGFPFRFLRAEWRYRPSAFTC